VERNSPVFLDNLEVRLVRVWPSPNPIKTKSDWLVFPCRYITTLLKPLEVSGVVGFPSAPDEESKVFSNASSATAVDVLAFVECLSSTPSAVTLNACRNLLLPAKLKKNRAAFKVIPMLRRLLPNSFSRIFRML
jgi:hypothetical protein